MPSTAPRQDTQDTRSIPPGSTPVVPVADQPTQTLSQREIAAQLLTPGRRNATRARERIVDRHLALTEGDRWLAECLVLAEDRHTLGTLLTRAWRTHHALASADDLGRYAPEVFAVPSATDAGVTYRVTYEGTSERYTCDCHAGQFAAPCHHVGAAFEFLRCLRRAYAPTAARAALSYEATSEDVERMQGMRQAYELSRGGGGQRGGGREGGCHRVDDDEW